MFHVLFLHISPRRYKASVNSLSIISSRLEAFCGALVTVIVHYATPVARLISSRTLTTGCIYRWRQSEDAQLVCAVSSFQSAVAIRRLFVHFRLRLAFASCSGHLGLGRQPASTERPDAVREWFRAHGSVGTGGFGFFPHGCGPAYGTCWIL